MLRLAHTLEVACAWGHADEATNAQAGNANAALFVASVSVLAPLPVKWNLDSQQLADDRFVYVKQGRCRLNPGRTVLASASRLTDGFGLLLAGMGFLWSMRAVPHGVGLLPTSARLYGCGYVSVRSATRSATYIGEDMTHALKRLPSHACCSGLWLIIVWQRPPAEGYAALSSRCLLRCWSRSSALAP